MARRPEPLFVRALHALCWGFALWTLCAHAVVWAGGTLVALLVAYALAGAGALWTARALRRRGATSASAEADADADANADTDADAAEPAAETPEAPAWQLVLAPLVALLAAGVALWRDAPLVLWTLWVAVLAVAAVWFVLREPARFEAPRDPRGARWGLLALTFACALYALCVRRPDADDAFYVNLAVAAIDLPELPLLARDTLHGRFDLPIHYPAYRLHSWELWNAAIAKLTGIPAVAVFHLVSAAVAAALVPLAHAVLFRQLAPRAWLWATLALVVVLAAPGDVHRWYGNFAFVRIWQGKGVFLFVFVPLIHAFAMRYARRGDAHSWGLLAATQVAGLGCTSTAIWAGPVAALVALASVLRPVPGDLRRLALGVLACAYPVVAGLAIKADMAGAIPELAREFEPGVKLDRVLHTVFGPGLLYTTCVVTLFAAWSVQRGLARRFAIVVPLAVALVLLNPWADAWVRANVSGPSLWRVMWALPVPILLSLVAVAPFSWAPRSATVPARLLCGAVCAALVGAFVLGVPRVFGFDPRNGASLGWPRLALPDHERWAHLTSEAAPRQRVVAPPTISAWIPVRHDHAYPMQVRGYLGPLREQVGRMAYRDRGVMTWFTDGIVDHPHAAAIFERGLDQYDVRAVCMRNSETLVEGRQILRRLGFTKRVQGSDFEIWSR